MPQSTGQLQSDLESTPSGEPGTDGAKEVANEGDSGAESVSKDDGSPEVVNDDAAPDPAADRQPDSKAIDAGFTGDPKLLDEPDPWD